MAIRRELKSLRTVQDAHTIVITRVTATATEQTHTLDTRCRSVMVRIPTATDAGGSQANASIRVGLDANSTDDAGNHIKVEHGAPYSWAEVEALTFRYRRQGATNLEVEIVEQLGQ